MKRVILMLSFLFLTMPVIVKAQQPPQLVTDQTQAFIKGGFVVKGEGVPKEGVTHPGQKELTAKRAATVVAQRNMAEILNGVRISGQTTVKDSALESDLIRSTVEGLIKDAKPIYESYDSLKEVAIVYISVGIDGPNGLTGQLLPQMLPTLPQPQAAAYVPPATLPPAPPQPYDALILDIKEHQFKPALINRILAQNGEILYDPTKIAQNILVERGAGDYTNDVGKAKAILSERGSRNPLVIKAAGVVKLTDVQVTGDDAANIFTANQKSNFLEGAKVVFVLK
jgi:hypothetical protein